MFTTRHNRSYRVMSTQWALSSTIGEMWLSKWVGMMQLY
jgi:hypothetical protein